MPESVWQEHGLLSENRNETGMSLECGKYEWPSSVDLLHSNKKSYRVDKHYQSWRLVVICYHSTYGDTKPLLIASSFSTLTQGKPCL